MTTALAVAEPRTPAVLAPWNAWGEKMAFAKELVGTGFCPSAIKTPAQALAVILTGQELGIPPMHSLRSIHIIQGKPTLSAELMLALMLKGGVKLTWKVSTSEVAGLLAERGTTAFTGTFTLAEAETAKLTNKDGWRNYPAAMLRARVIALTARVVAPDLIAGMYTAEELGADVDAEGTVVSAPTPVVTVIEPEPMPEEPPPADAPAPYEEWKAALESATAAGLKAVWAGCSKKEVWATFTLDQQTDLLDTKDARKRDLGLG